MAKIRIRKQTEADALRAKIAAARWETAAIERNLEQAFSDAWRWGGGEKVDPDPNPQEHRDDMFAYWVSDRIFETFR